MSNARPHIALAIVFYELMSQVELINKIKTGNDEASKCRNLRK
jgi:hypothetical protein